MLQKLTLEGSNSGPHLLITAGVHGDEYEPMEACRRVYHKVREMKKRLKGKVTIVPVVNKPAFELASRTGPDQFDLARVCPGNDKGSETEQIAHEVSELIRTADYYIDMHNGGCLHKIYPFVGYTLHQDDTVLNTQRELAKSFMLPIIWGTDPKMEGRTLSVARDANIPSIYSEIGGAGIYDEHMTDLAFKGCINVLKFLEMIPGKAKKEKTRYHVEDARKNSGHLQKLLPSPCDGFYIPKVSLGQQVTVGEVIGEIQDDLGKNSTNIKADQSGLIFILRNPPSVKKGDPLGAILPTIENDKIQLIYE